MAQGQAMLNVWWDVDDLMTTTPALIADYKSHKLRMAAEGNLYVGWIDGARCVSAKTERELYRKFKSILEGDRQEDS
jgi:hypothetical protein